MRRSTRILLGLAAATGIGLGSYGVASATSAGPTGDDDGPGETNDSDTPLSGGTLDQAVAAALAHTGGGEVTDTEVGDDGAAYGVEIRLPDGSQVEVNLDESFTVIGSEADDD
jgi:uncharacterized membrane protein YkoI